MMKNFILLIICALCYTNVPAQSISLDDIYAQLNKDKKKSSVTLAAAFEKIKTNKAFRKSDYNPCESISGNFKCVFSPNSSTKSFVQGILNEIPANELYRKSKDSRGIEYLFYIEKNNTTHATMLYVILGNGGNELIVTLFTGVKDYKRIVDRIKIE